MQRSDQGRTGANNARQARSAHTGSAENQSCSLQRETQCCADERMENVGAEPPSSAEASAQSRLVQVAASPCGNAFSARCRVVGTASAETGGSFSCRQQQEQPTPHWHLDGTLEAV